LSEVEVQDVVESFLDGTITIENTECVEGCDFSVRGSVADQATVAFTVYSSDPNVELSETEAVQLETALEELPGIISADVEPVTLPAPSGTTSLRPPAWSAALQILDDAVAGMSLNSCHTQAVIGCPVVHNVIPDAIYLLS